jgi:hypothetical protein
MNVAQAKDEQQNKGNQTAESSFGKQLEQRVVGKFRHNIDLLLVSP